MICNNLYDLFLLLILYGCYSVDGRSSDSSSEAIRVNSSFLLLEEDWSVLAPLPISICSKKFKFLKIASGNDQDTFSLKSINETCGFLKLEKPLDADQLHPDGSRSQSFTLHLENKFRMRAEIEIQIVDINDNAPKFIETKKEIPVSENAPKGTLLTSIQTFDPDKGIGGISKFFIKDERFSITNERCSNSRCYADIILNAQLDYETSPKINLTVVAKDGASRTTNSKESQVNIVIIVIDEEDSPPFFLSDLAVPILVRENTKPGHKIFQVRAEDGDKKSEKKNAIRFLLEPNELFSIEAETGWLTLEKELDFEQQRNYSLNIQAMESGENAMVTDGVLLIHVEDIDDNVPRCLEESYEMSLNASSWKFTLNKPIQVFDADEGVFASFTASIKGGNEIVFIVIPEIITKSATLDLEISNVDTSLLNSNVNQIKYEIVLSPSTNSSSRSGHCNLFVQLINSSATNNNINNNKNGLTQEENGESNSGVPVKPLTKADVTTAPTKPTTRLTNSILNKETDQKDDTKATDLNINEKPKLFFTQSSYSVQLSCKTPINTIVAVVKPKDVNEGTTKEVNYSLIGAGQGVNSSFAIDKYGGVITLLKMLDSNTNVSLEVVAKYVVNNETTQQTVQMSISIFDCATLLHSLPTMPPAMPVEEEKPSLFFGEIAENSPIGTKIIKLPIIIQKDKANVTYKVSLQETKIPLLKLTEDGSLSIGQIIDYEKFKELNGHVVEYEEDLSKILANFTVYVRDLNDNPPVFKAQQFEVELVEDIEVGTMLELPYPLATDDDSGKFSKLRYSFVKGSSVPFEIDENTSEIKVNASLDYESVKRYELEVKAIDNADGDFNNEARSKVIVIVKNINDNAPIFTPSKIDEFEISEDDMVGTIVTIIKANDLDENDQITYSLHTTKPEDNNLFAIDNEGKIVLENSLKGKVGSRYSVEIKASDSGSPALTATKKIGISIKKASNGPIIIWPKQNSVHFFKENEDYQSLLTINATLSEDELIKNVDYKLKFSLVELPNDDWKNFIINDTGSLKAKQIFDYEAKSKYELQIEICTEKDRCVMSNFRIMVTDINDNCPLFAINNALERYEIMENIPISSDENGVKVAEMIGAVDYDGTLELQSICYRVLDPANIFFFPDPKIATIYTNISLDREQNEFFNVVVSAFDCNENNPKLACKDPSFNSTRAIKVVTVAISDVNDNYPTFSERVFYGEIIQGKTKFGDIILNVEARDPDIEKEGLSYSVLPKIQIGTQFTDSERLPFSINSRTGEIANNLFMNLDSPKNYTFNVAVRDSAGHGDEAKVVITVVEHNEQVEIIFDADVSFIHENQKEIEKKLYEATSLKFIIDGITDMGNDTKVCGHFLNQFNTVVPTHSVLSYFNRPVSDWQKEAQEILFNQYKMKPLHSTSGDSYDLEENSLHIIIIVFSALTFLILILLCCICKKICCKKKSKLSQLEKFRRQSMYHTGSLRTESLKMPPPPAPFVLTGKGGHHHHQNVQRSGSNQQRMGDMMTSVDIPFMMSPSDNSSELSSSSSEESDELENIGIDTHSGIKIPPSTPRIMNGNITVTKANNTLVPEFNKYKDAVSDGTIIIGNLDLIEEELATGKKAVKNNENNVSSEIKPKIPKSFASERWSRDVSQKKVPTVKNVTAVEYPKAWAAWISLDDEEGSISSTTSNAISFTIFPISSTFPSKNSPIPSVTVLPSTLIKNLQSTATTLSSLPSTIENVSSKPTSTPFKSIFALNPSALLTPIGTINKGVNTTIFKRNIQNETESTTPKPTTKQVTTSSDEKLTQIVTDITKTFTDKVEQLGQQIRESMQPIEDAINENNQQKLKLDLLVQDFNRTYNNPYEYPDYDRSNSGGQRSFSLFNLFKRSLNPIDQSYLAQKEKLGKGLVVRKKRTDYDSISYNLGWVPGAILRPLTFGVYNGLSSLLSAMKVSIVDLLRSLGGSIGRLLTYIVNGVFNVLSDTFGKRKKRELEFVGDPLKLIQVQPLYNNNYLESLYLAQQSCDQINNTCNYTSYGHVLVKRASNDTTTSILDDVLVSVDLWAASLGQKLGGAIGSAGKTLYDGVENAVELQKNQTISSFNSAVKSMTNYLQSYFISLASSYFISGKKKREIEYAFEENSKDHETDSTVTFYSTFTDVSSSASSSNPFRAKRQINVQATGRPMGTFQTVTIGPNDNDLSFLYDDLEPKTKSTTNTSLNNLNNTIAQILNATYNLTSPTIVNGFPTYTAKPNNIFATIFSNDSTTTPMPSNSSSNSSTIASGMGNIVTDLKNAINGIVPNNTLGLLANTTSNLVNTTVGLAGLLSNATSNLINNISSNLFNDVNINSNIFSNLSQLINNTVNLNGVVGTGNATMPTLNGTLNLNGTTTMPALNGTTMMPNLNSTTMKPNANVSAMLPNLSGTTMMPSLNGTTKMPSLNSTTMMPISNGATMMSNVNSTTVKPNSTISTANSTAFSTTSSNQTTLPLMTSTPLPTSINGTLTTLRTLATTLPPPLTASSTIPPLLNSTMATTITALTNSTTIRLSNSTTVMTLNTTTMVPVITTNLTGPNTTAGIISNITAAILSNMTTMVPVTSNLTTMMPALLNATTTPPKALNASSTMPLNSNSTIVSNVTTTNPMNSAPLSTTMPATSTAMLTSTTPPGIMDSIGNYLSNFYNTLFGYSTTAPIPPSTTTVPILNPSNIPSNMFFNANGTVMYANGTIVAQSLLNQMIASLTPNVTTTVAPMSEADSAASKFMNTLYTTSNTVLTNFVKTFYDNFNKAQAIPVASTLMPTFQMTPTSIAASTVPPSNGMISNLLQNILGNSSNADYSKIASDFYSAAFNRKKRGLSFTNTLSFSASGRKKRDVGGDINNWINLTKSITNSTFNFGPTKINTLNFKEIADAAIKIKNGIIDNDNETKTIFNILVEIYETPDEKYTRNESYVQTLCNYFEQKGKEYAKTLDAVIFTYMSAKNNYKNMSDLQIRQALKDDSFDQGYSFGRSVNETMFKVNRALARIDGRRKRQVSHKITSALVKRVKRTDPSTMSYGLGQYLGDGLETGISVLFTSLAELKTYLINGIINLLRNVMMMWQPVLLLLLGLATTSAVDKSKFKTCDQAAFCKRHRSVLTRNGYTVEASSIKVNDTAIEATIVSAENKLKLIVAGLKDSTLRIVVDELESIRHRFQPLVALDGEPVQSKLGNVKTEKGTTQITINKDVTIKIVHTPFKLDILNKNEVAVSFNSDNLLKFEHFRQKVDGKDDGEGFWEEEFSGHKDSKPYGSSSVGLDINFYGFKYIYGLPEHADGLALANTKNTEPYRLYNLDVFEYELDSKMALYGAIPYVVVHSKTSSMSLLWLNAAETWFDVNNDHSGQIKTHFISESGLIDIFVFLGPKPDDLYRQYSSLTGKYPLPPHYSIAYHQCRWNYNDEEDVKQVNAGFDEHDIPMDVLWLDIEHTDDKKYFTWDKSKFSKPLEMVEELTKKGRKLVNIVDPHIKRDDGYFVYNEGESNGYFVKNVNGEGSYQGHCWPGASMYPDFVNPEVRKWWKALYGFDKYILSNNDVMIWNDMNEPSVFNGPEVTMPKDIKHHGDFEHRDIHNVYGLLHHSSSYQGLIDRSQGKYRPFVLTRSFFAGSQRSAAVWTGDNTAEWGHLKTSIPMILSLSVSGIPHIGADVGGFFKNVEDELLIRWYQMGAFSPFFRAHAHIDCKRREPWLFEDNTKLAIRKAIRQRYFFLPFWYTLFHEHTLTGKPVVRPLWSEFPEDESAFDEEKEFLLGNALLVRPVTEPGVSAVSLYLPGKKEIWYEWDSHSMRPSPGAIYMDTPITKIPLLQRGGTIIPTRSRIRRSSKLMKDDPITLYIAADYAGNHANGSVYLDDGETYEYKTGEYLYWGFEYKKVSSHLYAISSKNLDKKGVYESEVYVEKIVIRGVRYFPTAVHIYLDDLNPEDLEFHHNRDQSLLVIKKPGCFVSSEFRIDIHH
uniref:Cadherin domain-containing protein n=1 Tax=Rhabditophanes sp. KR3021 TaxID=114890 RepID=A0AC35TZI0_9BILA